MHSVADDARSNAVLVRAHALAVAIRQHVLLNERPLAFCHQAGLRTFPIVHRRVKVLYRPARDDAVCHHLVIATANPAAGVGEIDDTSIDPRLRAG